MKGLIYKNYLITRKYYFMAFAFFVITALFMILIRLSMICGNISHDAEAVSDLTRSMWIFRYMPCEVIILGFAGYGETFFTDLNAGWAKFSRTTSLSVHKIVGSYFISKGIVTVFAYIMCLLYLVIFCLSFGDKISWNYIANVTSLFCLGVIMQYYDLALSMFVKKRQTVQLISISIALIFSWLLCAYIYPRMKELENPDTVLLEWMAQQLEPIKIYILPVMLCLAVIYTVGGYFISVKGLERRTF